MKRTIYPLLMAAVLLAGCANRDGSEPVPETTVQTAAATAATASETTVQTETTAVISAAGTYSAAEKGGDAVSETGSSVTSAAAQSSTFEMTELTAQTAVSVESTAVQTAATAKKADVQAPNAQELLADYLDAIKRKDTDACIKMSNADAVFRLAEQYPELEKENIIKNHVEYLLDLGHQSYRIVSVMERPDLIQPYQEMLDEGRKAMEETDDASEREFIRQLLVFLGGYDAFYSVDVAFDDETDEEATGFLLYRKDGVWGIDAVIADEADLLVSRRERCRSLSEFNDNLASVCVDIVRGIIQDGGDASPLLNKVITWGEEELNNVPEQMPENKVSSEFLRYAAKQNGLHLEYLSEVRIWITNDRIAVASADLSGLVVGYPAEKIYDSIEEAIEIGKTGKDDPDTEMHFRF